MDANSDESSNGLASIDYAGSGRFCDCDGLLTCEMAAASLTTASVAKT
jgi:hypothetical protein